LLHAYVFKDGLAENSIYTVIFIFQIISYVTNATFLTHICSDMAFDQSEALVEVFIFL